MNEADTELGPCGALVGGRLVADSVCGSCGHAHEWELVHPNGHHQPYSRYISGCDVEGCYCTANLDAYARGITDTPDLAVFDSTHDVDLVAAFLAAEHDDDYSGPRCLPGPSDAAGTRAVVTRGQLRRGRLDRLLRYCLSGLVGYLSGELGRERWRI